MNLSEHFTLAEFTISQTAARKRLDNTPGPGTIENLKIIAGKMERVRALLGKPVIINSGYRSPSVNAAIGGVATSAHCMGYAADFICPAFGTPFEVAHAIADSRLNFDQLIWEGTWVHLSVDPRMRREVLTMQGGKYRKGLPA